MWHSTRMTHCWNHLNFLNTFKTKIQSTRHKSIQRKSLNMKLRARPYPRCFNDWATTLFLSAAIPLTYWFELWIVTPAVSANALYNTFNFVLGTFLLFNVVGNMVALMLCNTSIIGEKIIRPAKTNSSLWKFCAICETVTPPRSWHCSTCRVCILKRDHHCMFTGMFKPKNEKKKNKSIFN